ncbi:MAG: hypothetical protein RR182_08630 [Alistipes sp.]
MKQEKMEYNAPKLEMYALTVEQGFAQTNGGLQAGANDYQPGDEQSHD